MCKRPYDDLTEAMWDHEAEAKARELAEIIAKKILALAHQRSGKGEEVNVILVSNGGDVMGSILLDVTIEDEGLEEVRPGTWLRGSLTINPEIKLMNDNRLAYDVAVIGHWDQASQKREWPRFTFTGFAAVHLAEVQEAINPTG